MHLPEAVPLARVGREWNCELIAASLRGRAARADTNSPEFMSALANHEVGHLHPMGQLIRND